MPGLDFSNDPLLAGRIHSYVDTQISRLGGRIRIGTTRGEYCHFRVQLPLTKADETTQQNEAIKEAA